MSRQARSQGAGEEGARVESVVENADVPQALAINAHVEGGEYLLDQASRPTAIGHGGARGNSTRLQGARVHDYLPSTSDLTPKWALTQRLRVRMFRNTGHFPGFRQ